MPIKQVILVMKTIQLEPVSLDAPIAENLSLEDYIPDENYNSPEFNVQLTFLKQNVEKLLKELNNKERKIITERFGINGNKPKTLEQLGKDMGFSKERIRQIEAMALKKLRTKNNIKQLREFLI
jgi:RNA polymerase primary sigma factor